MYWRCVPSTSIIWLPFATSAIVPQPELGVAGPAGVAPLPPAAGGIPAGAAMPATGGPFRLPAGLIPCMPAPRPPLAVAMAPADLPASPPDAPEPAPAATIRMPPAPLPIDSPPPPAGEATAAMSAESFPQEHDRTPSANANSRLLRITTSRRHR